MRIKTYQGGGIVYLPTVNQMGAAQNTAASSGSSESAGKVPGFSKELIDLIKENGIDSDVTVFLNRVQKTLDLANDPTGENLSLKEILKIQRDANRVKQNLAAYKTAEQSLESQDAWAEPATTARGWLYIQDAETGKIKTINPSEYDPNKQVALTNQDLMNLRRANPEMAFQTDVLDNISSAVGMKTITDYARNLIKDFGKTTITGYSDKQAGQIREGMAHIVSGDLGDVASLISPGPDGLYKISQEATIVDSNIKAALDYLKTTLPNSYINTLRAKSAAEGYDPDAMLLVMMYADTDRKFTADYDPTATKIAVGGASGSGGSESLTEDNLAIKFAKGDLTETTAFISPKARLKSDKSQMALHAWNGGVPQKENGDRLTRNNMANLAKDTFQLAGADFASITFANQVIGADDLRKFVWDGVSSVDRVALPVKYVNGKQVPDFDLLQTLNEVNEKVANNPGITDLEIQQDLKEHEADGIVWDPKQRKYIIDPSRIGFFATMAAYGSKDLLKLEDQSIPYVEMIPRRDGRMLRDEFNSFVQYGKATHGRKEVSNGLPDSERNDFYYGNIYIAITDPMQATNVTKNQFYPKSVFTNVNQKWELGQNIQAAQQYSEWKTQL